MAAFCLELDIFQTNVVEGNKIAQFTFSKFLFLPPKNLADNEMKWETKHDRTPPGAHA